MEAHLKAQINKPHAVISSKQRSNKAFRIGNPIDVETTDQVDIHLLAVRVDGRLEQHIASGLMFICAGISFICAGTSFRLLGRVARLGILFLS